MSRRIFSEIGTILLAVGMAFLVWVAAAREKNPPSTEDYAIPLKIVDPASDLILLNKDELPSEMQVKVRAPRSILDTLTTNKLKAEVDLSTYVAGLHDIPVEVNILDDQVTLVEQNLSVLNIQLEPLETKIIPITIQITDDPPLGYFNRLPTIDPISVTIKGSTVAVTQVDQVVARVQINGSKKTVTTVAPLLARTTEGAIIRTVNLEPNEGSVTIPIVQRFGYKDVSVQAKVIGQPDPGYWISSISLEPATVTLVGGPSVLNQITGLIETADIDVTGTTENVVKRVPLQLPPGASIVVDEDERTENDRSVLVTVGISALTGGQRVQANVTVQGASQTLGWSITPEQVEVILSGPLPILNNLAEDDITLLVDLFRLPPGTYPLQPTVIKPDGIEVVSLIPDTVEVTIKPIIRQTPTAIPTVRGTTTITETDTITTSNIISDVLPITSTLSLTNNLSITSTDTQD